MRYKHIFNYKERRLLDPNLIRMYNKVSKKHNVSFQQVKDAFDTAIEWQKKSMRNAEYLLYIWDRTINFKFCNIVSLCQLDREKYYNRSAALKDLYSVKNPARKLHKAKVMFNSYCIGNEELLKFINTGPNEDLAKTIEDKYHPVFFSVIMFYYPKLLKSDASFELVREFGFHSLIPSQYRLNSWNVIMMSNHSIEILNLCISLIESFINYLDKNKLVELHSYKELTIDQEKQIKNVIKTLGVKTLGINEFINIYKKTINYDIN